MNLVTLKTHVRQWVHRSMQPILNVDTPPGTLSDSEHATIHALLQIISNDELVDAQSCRRFIDDKTLRTKGALDAFRRTTQLVDDTSRRLHGRRFSKLQRTEQDDLLHRLFIEYPYEERLPAWVRHIHLSPHTLSLIAEVGDFRVMRHYVMPELLSWYYTSERGWAVVEWKDYPGKPRGE